MPVSRSFSEFLAAAGLDESKLSTDRAMQLRAFWKTAIDEDVLLVSKDANGAEIHIGDMVTITLKVTGIHKIADDVANGLIGRTSLNLARVAGDVDLHQFSLASSIVKKA